MRNARVTVLMKPEEKKALEQRAERLGVSSGEYIRLAVDNYENISAGEEAELAALVAEANAAIPKMAESVNRISQRMQAMHEETDAFLREMGVRK